MGKAAPPPFLLAFTDVRAHPMVPEIRLRLAGDTIALWGEAEEAMGRGELAPPFWASVWPGGVALARYLLDHPALVAGRTVIDVATGSGVVGSPRPRPELVPWSPATPTSSRCAPRG